MRHELNRDPIVELNKNRYEERWNILPENIHHIEKSLSKYERIHYDNPWVTTIYFGGVKVDEHGNEIIVPLQDVKVSLKARQFNSNFFDEPIKILDPNQQYRFEIKTRPTWDDTSPQRWKFTTNASLDEINNALFSGQYSKFGKSDNLPVHLLTNALDKMGCTRFVPIGMVQYHRQHFINDGKIDNSNGQRITFDTHVSLWDIDWTGYNYVAARIRSLETGVLEIKNKDGTKEYPDFLKKIIFGLDLSESKHDLLFANVGSNLGVISEVEHKVRNQGWEINEIELKLDVDRDPQLWLLELDLGSDYLLTRLDQQLTRQRFFMLGDDSQSACIMEYFSIDRPNQIKAKKSIDSVNNYHSRIELAIPDILENRKIISEFLGKDLLSLALSPSFERRRSLRTLISTKTGRVFEIVADNCVANDERPNLFQIEVEYSGMLTGFVPSNSVVTSIEEDLNNIKLKLQVSLMISNFNIKSSHMTKSKWICASIR